MNSHERHLASVTTLAIIVISGLAFVPLSVLLTVVGPILLVSTIASVVMLSRALSRPLTPFDEECDRIDRELDREAQEARRARRLQRQRAREVSPIRHVGGGWRL